VARVRRWPAFRLGAVMTRRLLILLVLAAALVVGGCGNKMDTRTTATTEGPYLDVGDLKYQVQISRILNPADIEDRNYMTNLPAGTLPPKANEAWFGVWVRVENTDSSKPLPTASEFEIRDTQGNVYKPYAQIGNPFAYAPVDKLGHNEVLPNPDAPAGFGPIQGALLLFKLTTDTLQNRPLEFRITSPSDPTDVGTVDLDV
jgi:hypothetical protein